MNDISVTIIKAKYIIHAHQTYHIPTQCYYLLANFQLLRWSTKTILWSDVHLFK